MKQSERRSRHPLPLPQRERLDKLCDDFERRWRTKDKPRIKEFMDLAEEADREHLFRELIEVELELRREGGERPEPDEYRRRFPLQHAIVDSVFDATIKWQPSEEGKALPDEQPERAVKHSAQPDPSSRETEIPQAIGRYEIERVLGQGAFGVVYLAHDTQLDRQVALKVPRLDRFDSHGALKLFVQEARNAAQLDHAGIVRVHDVQQEPA